MLLVFGAEAILELQVTLADVVTSTASIYKGDLGDKRFVVKKAMFEKYYSNKGSDIVDFVIFERDLQPLLWLCFPVECSELALSQGGS